MRKPIYIMGAGTVSAAGSDPNEVNDAFKTLNSTTTVREFSGKPISIFSINPESENKKDALIKELGLRHCDRVTELALLATHTATANWKSKNRNRTAVILGSARGATGSFENYHKQFLDSGRVPSFTSPITTAGNISSAVAQSLNIAGLDLSISMTCVSALHSILIAATLLNGGVIDQCIAGGSEAPLTDFTVSQMQALKIYSKDTGSYPCRPCMSGADANTFVLGEGAGAFLLQMESDDQDFLGRIIGIGMAHEAPQSLTAMDREGSGFKKSMKEALADAELENIDAIILHAPGTLLGDKAELNGIHTLFGEKIPQLFSTKYLTGHTFGASGALSIDLGLRLLNGMAPPKFPYATLFCENEKFKAPKKVLINAAGFGGNVMSVIIAL